MTDAKDVVSEFFSVYNSDWVPSGINNMTPDKKLQQFHLSLNDKNNGPVLDS